MDINKDYYAILGVSTTAEDVVIRAAYKALSQRYHPDKHQKSPEYATTRMTEINEAYSILSNPIARSEYDKRRGGKTQSGQEYFSEADSPPSYDPLDHDWKVAIKYFPELQTAEKMLAVVSWRLAYSFKAYLIDTKSFDKAKTLSIDMLNNFLKVYFGANQRIINFAKYVIFNGKRDAALALNEAIRILGNSVNHERIIQEICKEYNIATEEELNKNSEYYVQLLNSCGYKVNYEYGYWVIETPTGVVKKISELGELIRFTTDATSEIKDQLDGQKGGLIVCSVDNKDLTSEKILIPGDVIVKFNNHDVRNNKVKLVNLLKDSAGLVSVHFYRDNKLRTIDVIGHELHITVAQLV